MKKHTQVVCFFAELHPETRKSVRKYAPNTNFAYTGDSDTAYKEILKSFWDWEPGDLVTIEQDIEINRKVIKSFRKCDRDWCTFSYQGPPGMGYLYRSLGCAKFSKALRRKYPFDVFYAHGGEALHGSDNWWDVDMNVIRHLCETEKLVPHVHGHLNHHHAYQVSTENHPINCRQHVAPGVYNAIAKELQVDGTWKAYAVNEDGSRGKFLYDIPPMPKFQSG